MMFSLLSALPLLALVAAQNATELEIQTIEANFEGAQLEPQLVGTFDPEAILGVSFGGNAITTGQNLTQDSVGSSPTLTLSPGSDAADVAAGNLYTVIMVDADVVGTDESTTAQTRHWLVNGVSWDFSGTAPYAINYTGATSVTDYAGPGPAAGSGSHRYTLLVYLQPSTFSPPANLSAAGTPLSTMFLSSYVSESGLQGPVAGNYFQVENGTPTAAVVATTAVNTATLSTASSASSAAASSASSASGSGSVASVASSSAAASGAASAAASASASAAATGGANSRSELAWGAVIGGMGVAGTVLGAVMGL